MCAVYECPAGHSKEIELDIQSLSMRTFDETNESLNFCEHCAECSEDEYSNVQFVVYNEFGTTKKVKSCWLVIKKE